MESASLKYLEGVTPTASCQRLESLLSTTGSRKGKANQFAHPLKGMDKVHKAEPYA